MSGKRASRSRLIFGRADQKTARKCLCCSGDFVSYGPHNRLCSRCRQLDSDFSMLGFDRSRR